MWLYIVVAALVVVGIAGGFFAGGIFTIVLLPIAALILIGSVVYRSMAEAQERNQRTDHPEPTLPHAAPSDPGEVPTTPERLADERRLAQ